MPGTKKAHIWQRMRKWLSEAKSLCSPKDAKKFGLENLDNEINILEKELCKGYQEIGFCHNDLQYGNIMMDEKTKSITLIVSQSLRIHSLPFQNITVTRSTVL